VKEPSGGKRHAHADVARGISLVVLGCVASYSLAYWLFALARGAAAEAAAGFWKALAVYGISFGLFFGIMYAASRVFVGKQPRNYFSFLVDAMRRIAAGDLDVSLPVVPGERAGAMDEVVTSLNAMTESLRKMEAMRQEFVSDVSHEIQSPLTSIMGFARALREDGLDADRRRHYLDIVESESRRLSRLADSLLRLSALDSRAQPVAMAPLALDAQLRSVILTLEPQWREKGLDVEADLEPVTLDGDEALLGQVWGNLIHNAVKFTPAGGTVHVSCRTVGDRAVVRVEDSGIGIAAEDLPQVFDRFFKADRSRTRGQGGNGLGLAIAQKIVVLHGGATTAASAGPGAGAVFEVSLPLRAPLTG
jgi:two-component system, OmpR family, phosphate regulon sensor histidine kinase PhoR